MADKTWKQAERRIADLLGGRRIPVTGRGDAADIEHPLWALEVKHWKKLPNWLFHAMRQAKASQRNGRLPVVVLHQAGQRYEDSFVVMRLSDLVKLQRRL